MTLSETNAPTSNSGIAPLPSPRGKAALHATTLWPVPLRGLPREALALGPKARRPAKCSWMATAARSS
eukprot:3021365-Pyramimonas_sp.AAC.1